MPPEQQPTSGIKWNEVTWYSKLGAIIVFLGIVPALSFYIGMQYARVQDVLVYPDPSGVIPEEALNLTYKTYYSEKHDVTLQIPENWIVDESVKNGYYDVIHLAVKSPDFVIQLPVAEGDGEVVQGGSIELWSITSPGRRSDESCTGNCISNQNIVMDGEPGTLFIYKGVGQDFWTDASVNHDGKHHTFGFKYSDNLKDHDEILDQFIKGFRFGSSAAIAPCKELYEDDLAQYDYWEKKFTTLHPNFRVYDAGSYCRLSDNNQLVSFSFFKPYSGEWTGINANNSGQSIALFDDEGNLLAETEGLFEETLGDLGYPRITSVKNGVVTFVLAGGDAGYSESATYELQLKDFTFLKIGSTSQGPE